MVETALQADIPEQHTHPIIFESINGPLISTTALHTSGSAGPSEIDMKDGGKCALLSMMLLNVCVRRIHPLVSQCTCDKGISLLSPVHCSNQNLPLCILLLLVSKMV